VPALLTGTAGLVLGLVVPVLDPLVNALARDATGTDPELHLALWHGFTLPLGLSGLVVVVGTLLYRSRRRVIALQGAARSPAAPRCSTAPTTACSPSAPASAGPRRRTRRRATCCPSSASRSSRSGPPRPRSTARELGGPAPSLAGDSIVIVLLLGAVTAVVVARGRLAAIAALGLSGFVVATWFVLLGAPDLALTQLLIETLTVALVVLVFRRLPGRFPDPGRRRQALAIPRRSSSVSAPPWPPTSPPAAGAVSEVGERLLTEGEGLTGGANVVNTILVDFRALDTLGEIVVLAVAALGIVALIRMVPRDAVPQPPRSTRR
jgi:multicomponent Na+:H+ antiporter subunit A